MPGRDADIGERAVAVIAIEPMGGAREIDGRADLGQPGVRLAAVRIVLEVDLGRVAHIEIEEAVAVDVAQAQLVAMWGLLSSLAYLVTSTKWRPPLPSDSLW